MRKTSKDDKALTSFDLDNIIRLYKMGWTIEEISLALKFDKCEVELIIETADMIH